MNALQKLLESSRILEYVAVDHSGVIHASNVGFAQHVSTDPVIGELVYKFLPEDDALIVQEWLRREVPQDMVLLNFLSVANSPYTLRCFLEVEDDVLHIVGELDAVADARTADQLVAINNEMATLAREYARRERELASTREQLENVRAQLQRQDG